MRHFLLWCCSTICSSSSLSSKRALLIPIKFFVSSAQEIILNRTNVKPVQLLVFTLTHCPSGRLLYSQWFASTDWNQVILPNFHTFKCSWFLLLCFIDSWTSKVNNFLTPAWINCFHSSSAVTQQEDTADGRSLLRRRMHFIINDSMLKCSMIIYCCCLQCHHLLVIFKQGGGFICHDIILTGTRW